MIFHDMNYLAVILAAINTRYWFVVLVLKGAIIGWMGV